MASKSSTDIPGPSYDGRSWIFVVTSGDLHAYLMQFSIPRLVILEVPRPLEHAVSSLGIVSQVALYPGMFTCRVCLPFCHPVWEVLHYLGLASA